MWFFQHWLMAACVFQCRVGDFSDPVVALWSRETFQLLSSVSTCGPIHDACFSPSAANQLACVGSHGVYFCFVHTRGSNVELRVNSSRTLCLFDDRCAELPCRFSFFIPNVFKCCWHLIGFPTCVGSESESTSRGGWRGADGFVLPRRLAPVHCQ